jgi:hypothetical protein
MTLGVVGLVEQYGGDRSAGHLKRRIAKIGALKFCEIQVVVMWRI